MKKLICMSLIILYGSCASQKKVHTDDLNLKLGVTKTKCFGKCPVYEFRVYENGDMVYHGIKNVDKIGTYIVRLTKNEMSRLEEEFKATGFVELQIPKQKVIRDMPFVVLTFENKVIRYQPGGEPAVLKDLVLKIEEMIERKIGV
ncbi:hypothetical protein GTQ40_08855 [Flavobacteriaceae bacterium R38]|nr:hypothetical protein [Flavobacteriaceae bacterium R38]